LFYRLCEQGFTINSEVDHPIAPMAFFDTYQTLGVATGIMGIKPKGLFAIKQMQKVVYIFKRVDPVLELLA
jgi:methylmalonyl-CoA/ethylmalonyl-CoA epimerase